jgi:hypothetical protein
MSNANPEDQLSCRAGRDSSKSADSRMPAVTEIITATSPGNIMVGVFGEVQVMDWDWQRRCSRPSAARRCRH